MKINSFVITILILGMISCKNDTAKRIQQKNLVDWKAASNYYHHHILKAYQLIDSLSKNSVDHKDNKELFIQLRQAFKKAESYASYLKPSDGHRANGPALPIFKEDNGKVMAPIGLQKIEETIYDGGVSQAEFDREVYITKGLIKLLAKTVKERPLNTQRFFIATHQQLLRIISHSITGFDTPVSGIGISEAAISLESLKDVYRLSLQKIIREKNNTLDKKFAQSIDNAVAYLQTHTDFATFDRFTFIKKYMNPITTNWVNIRKESNLWKPVNYTPFNFDALTFFESNSFNINHFTPVINRNPSTKKILLGKKLFFDPKLSKSGTMSCATCHNPALTYTDGLKQAINNHGGSQKRNAPTLINVAFQKNFFADGRAATILDQVTSVFLNKEEFNSKVHQFSKELLKDTVYIKEFKEAYGKVPNSNTDVIKAIASYISTLNGFNSRFDQNITGKLNDYTEEEQLGFNLFAGKALCATCHFLPLTNGTVPPFYAETEREVIGVPKTAANKQVDTDLGFYWRYEEDLHKGMFKTPTVRNSAKTGPYMHNGVYTTLEQVVDFYNKGGGAGLGFDLPHQTLPFDNLELTDKEQKAIVAFLKSLDDTKIGQDY